MKAVRVALDLPSERVSFLVTSHPGITLTVLLCRSSCTSTGYTIGVLLLVHGHLNRTDLVGHDAATRSWKQRSVGVLQLGTNSDATVCTGHQLIRENFTAALLRLLALVK